MFRVDRCVVNNPEKSIEIQLISKILKLILRWVTVNVIDCMFFCSFDPS